MGTESESESRNGYGRRAVVVGVGAVALGAVVLGQAALVEGERAVDVEGSLGPVVAGATIDRWNVVAVHPVRFGSVAVVLATPEGRRYQVDVLARDPNGPQGVANTERLSLYVSNRGDGSVQTDEEQGLGALALANTLRRYEGEADAELPPLMTLEQRNAKHPGGSFGVPLT